MADRQRGPPKVICDSLAREENALSTTRPDLSTRTVQVWPDPYRRGRGGLASDGLSPGFDGTLREITRHGSMNTGFDMARHWALRRRVSRRTDQRIIGSVAPRSVFNPVWDGATGKLSRGRQNLRYLRDNGPSSEGQANPLFQDLSFADPICGADT